MSDAKSRFAVSTGRADTGRSVHGGSSTARAFFGAFTGSSAPAFGRPPLRALLVLASAISAIALLLVASAPAGAAEHVTVTGEYGKEGPKATGTGNSCRIAYDSASNRLYLSSDSKIYGLQRTAPGSVTPLGGAFPITTGLNTGCGDPDLTVNPATGNIYAVPSNESIYGFSSAGAPLAPPWPVGTGGETCGVSSTNTGQVWGGNYGKEQVTKFTSAGVSAGSLALGYRSCKIEVNQQNNDLFVLNYSNSILTKYTAASGYTTSMSFGNVGTSNGGLAINGAENRIYVATNSGTTLKAYDTNTGAVVETIAIGAAPRDVAVDEGTDTLFVQVGSGGSGYIMEYLGVTVPKATTGEPTGNTEVSGTADPNGVGPITECYFEWGLSLGYGKKQNCTESVPFNTVQTVHAVLPPGEMVGEETYHYRLVLDTGVPNVIGRGGDKTIIPHYVKSVQTNPATEVTRTTAQLNGSFEGNGEATSYFFEYGLTACPCATRLPLSPTEQSAGSPASPTITPMSVNVSGLTPEKTYHYRVVAKNPQGSSPGKDVTFVTPDAVQDVVTEDATGQTRDTATLTGSFTGNGEAHTYEFEWGPDTSYGHKVGGSAGNATGKVPVSSPIEGLDVYLPSSLPYHYRLLVTNSTGTKVGPDHTFVPAPPGLPVISGLSAEDVSPTSAELTAMVNPEEGPTTYAFEYGPTNAYGSVTLVSAVLPGDVAEHQVAEAVADLSPGTTYHFRLVADNFGGTTHSADQTFVTPDAPKIESSASSAVTLNSAHLVASVVGNGSPTSVDFEYGTTDAYGSSTGAQPIGEEFIVNEVSANLSGLIPSTTYHFRVVASNGVGTVKGPDRTFTTRPAPIVEPPPPPQCKKPKVLRKGKCVKKPKKKKKKTHRGSHRNG